MTNHKKGDRSEAQLIADKHNGHCYCLSGALASIEKILYDCADSLGGPQILRIETSMTCIKSDLRLGIDAQFESEKDKSGKSTPQD